MIDKYIEKCISIYNKKYKTEIKNKKVDINKIYLLELIKKLNKKKINNYIYIYKKIKSEINSINIKYILNDFFIYKEKVKIDLIKLNFLTEKKEKFYLEILKNIIKSYKYDK